MTHGKLLWKDLKVVSATGYYSTHPSAPPRDYYGTINIYIPLKLYVPYDPMDKDMPWRIRTAIYKHLRKLQWPVDSLGSLYFFYYANYYHLQIMTKHKSTVEFYAELMTRQFSTKVTFAHP